MTQFKATPADHSSDTVVTFESDVSGCVFQWRLIDYTYNTVIRNWTTTAITTCETCASEGRLDLTWLPKGMLRLRIRAVDAAGHVEPTFREGENQHTWTYVPPFPWLILIGVLLGILAFTLAIFLELRRRRRKKAMERYAIKRMRRKFKGMDKRKQKDVPDWKKQAKVKLSDKDKKKKKKKKIKSGEVHHKHKRRHRKGDNRQDRSGKKGGGGGGDGGGGGRRKATRKHTGK